MGLYNAKKSFRTASEWKQKLDYFGPRQLCVVVTMLYPTWESLKIILPAHLTWQTDLSTLALEILLLSRFISHLRQSERCNENGYWNACKQIWKNCATEKKNNFFIHINSCNAKFEWGKMKLILTRFSHFTANTFAIVWWLPFPIFSITWLLPLFRIKTNLNFPAISLTFFHSSALSRIELVEIYSDEKKMKNVCGEKLKTKWKAQENVACYSEMLENMCFDELGGEGKMLVFRKVNLQTA